MANQNNSYPCTCVCSRSNATKFKHAFFVKSYLYYSTKVFTVETGGNKRVIVSGYKIFRDLFVKNAAFTSVHNTQGRDKALQQRFKYAPGDNC